jgi:hypothetical protein
MVREGMQQLDILKNLMGFQNLKQDVRRVRFIDGSEIVCRSVFGIEDIQIYVPEEIVERETVLQQYVYVTISDYVTIWDLGTGEVAEGVCDNEKEEIIFPCHKDELVTWLEGIQDRPTRQVLKDEPENNRDYLSDNGIDIGNENRVVCNPDPFKPPWYDIDCVGLDSCYTFLNVVKDEGENTCRSPNIPCRDCYWYNLLEKDSPKDYPSYTESWHSTYQGFELSCGSHYYECFSPGGEKCFLEVYKPKSQDLTLCPYPFKSFETGRCHGQSSFGDEVVDMICQQASFIYHYAKMDVDENNIYTPYINSSVYTYKTPLENLIFDFIPRKKLEEKSNLSNYKSLQETMRSTALSVSKNFDIINNHIAVNNLDESLAKYITNIYPNLSTEYWPLIEKGICKKTTKNLGDLYESDRYAVSWCEYPSKEKTKNEWYKVKLFFYMGKAFCIEKNGELVVGPYGGYTCVCGEAEETNYDRFSSVHATIELEHPEDYKKEKISVPGKPSWVKRYRRPGDYSKLGIFPGRESGYPEDGDYCYPFDGTYDIYTLGEAVEKLINNHYEDGSDDQLLVYLLSKTTTRKIPCQ